MIGTNIRTNNLYIFLENDDVNYLGNNHIRGTLIANGNDKDLGSLDLVINDALCNSRMKNIEISDKTEFTKIDWLTISIKEEVYRRIQNASSYNSQSDSKNVIIIDSSKDMSEYEKTIYDGLKKQLNTITKK